MYDLIIIGAGPAGTAAGVYAARKQLKTLLLTVDFGGQSVVSADIQNWIGTSHIPGFELATAFKKHLEEYAGEVLELHEGEPVESIAKEGEDVVVRTQKGEYRTHAVLIATGSHRRKLPVTGADTFEEKGLTYCASCDGPLFTGKDVAVIGGGNAGFETAAQLLAYTKSVTLFESSDTFRADPVTVEKVLAHPNMHAVKNATLVEVKGEKFVSGLVYREGEGEQTELPVQGVFVEIGLIPTTGFAKGVVDMNERDHVVIDPRTQKTSVSGIWAAGDCTDVLYHQNNIAAGDAVRALEDIYISLKAK